MSNIEEIRQTAANLRAELARPDAPLPTFAEARALAEGAIGLVEENARLTVVAESARSLVAAADACDREAERHPSSRSSAPMVRLINAMARLRQALGGVTAPGLRKPVAGWEKNPEAVEPGDAVLFMLRAGMLTAYTTSEGWWGIETDEEYCDDAATLVRMASVGYEGQDNTEAAQLAAEDELFRLADAINALRGGR